MNTRPTTGFARMILIGLIGNVMEWYDFAAHGFFAAVIGTLFFPADNPAISLEPLDSQSVRPSMRSGRTAF